MQVKIFTPEGILLETVDSDYENVKVREQTDGSTFVCLGKYTNNQRAFSTEEVIEIHGRTLFTIKRKAWNS